MAAAAAAAGLTHHLRRSRCFATIVNNTIGARPYGAAAAAQLQYDEDDYDYDYDYDYDDRVAPMVDGEGSEPRRGVQWVVIGEPGAMKHVYAHRLSQILRVPHISMGTLVRQELNPKSSLYKQIATSMSQGKLVTEDIIFSLLSKKLEEGYFRGETGFILEGIPRTRLQAEILDQLADINLVLNFKCSDTNLVKRELGHGFGFQSQGNHFKSSSEAAAWKEKLRVHTEQSKPLEDYYRKQKKLLDFQVAGAPGETWQGLLTALQLQHMNSFQKLTV